MDTAKQFACDTIEDIYNLPEGQRAELIDGEMYMMAAPDRIHQKLVMVSVSYTHLTLPTMATV